MTFDEYQQAAMRTRKYSEAINGALGLCGEAGEVADIIKKRYYPSKEGDKQPWEQYVASLCDELGDVLWYIALLADCLGTDLGAIAEGNITKLAKRHGVEAHAPQ